MNVIIQGKNVNLVKYFTKVTKSNYTRGISKNMII